MPVGRTTHGSSRGTSTGTWTGGATPRGEAMCTSAGDRGARGGKLTGAGCGGAMVALVDDDPEPVVRAFQAAGYAAFATEIDAGRTGTNRTGTNQIDPSPSAGSMAQQAQGIDHD